MPRGAALGARVEPHCALTTRRARGRRRAAGGRALPQGKALLKGGNVRGAYEEYKTAWDLKHTYDIAANLGNLELSSWMARDAAEHLGFSVRNYAVTGTTPERLEKTKQLLAQARAQVAALTIQVNIEGAEVAIDGRVVGRSPIVEEVYVYLGSRTIEARLVSYPTARLTVNAEKGRAQQVTLTLEAPAPVPTASSTATVPPPLATGPSKPVLIAGGTATGVGVVLGRRSRAYRQARQAPQPTRRQRW